MSIDYGIWEYLQFQGSEIPPGLLQIFNDENIKI